MAMGPRCAIFDYDLTLADLKLDRQVMMRHLLHACEALGLEGLVRSNESSFAAYRRIVDRDLAGDPDRERIKRLLDQSMAAGEFEALKRATLLQGARQVLSELSENEFRIGVVSSNSVRVIRATARRLRIGRFLEAVWGRESPGRCKPAPDRLLGCGQELGCRDAFYVGDDPTDMETALAAGFKGIAVLRFTERLPTPSEEELLGRGAQAVVRSLLELPSVLGMR